jgi:large subunit ribosomal protein MRP49
MRFAPKIDGGHMASRKFWRHELVRLKYHNPAIPMTIDRTALQTDPALMTVFFADSNAANASPASSPAPTTSTSGDKQPSDYSPSERTETIDMTGRTPENILSDLIKLTAAQQVQPNQEELDMLRSLEEQRIRSEKDSKLSLEVRQKKKREESLLAQARGEIESAV